MPPLYLLGFARIGCGCLVGRYHQVVSHREVDYVEDKGCHCSCPDHQRDQLLGVSHMTPEPVPVSARIAS